MATDNTVPGQLADAPQSDLTRGIENDPNPLEIGRRVGWRREHRWPVLGAFAILLFGMLYSFFWYWIVHHHLYWITPSDIWSTFRDAHYVIWSGEGDVYSANTNFVTFPGIAVFL